MLTAPNAADVVRRDADGIFGHGIFPKIKSDKPRDVLPAESQNAQMIQCETIKPPRPHTDKGYIGQQKPGKCSAEKCEPAKPGRIDVRAYIGQ